MMLSKSKLKRYKKLAGEKCDDGYKEFPCDLCRSTEAIKVPYASRYTKGQDIHICKNCGFVYVKKRRSYDRIAQVWSKELFGKAYTAKSPLMLARHSYVAEFIDQNLSLKNKKICDVGAGEGQFLNLIKKNYRASVFGIEPSSVNCKLMRSEGIKYFQGTLQDYLESFKHKQYRADIVTIMWTLENATSCNDLLLGAREILKDNGFLVVATGSRLLVPFSKPLYLYLSSNPADTHPARFSFNTLISFLNRTGFKVICANHYLNDSLALCVIAKKCKINKAARIKGDDFREVRDFFKRWHRETLFHRENQ
ncbi:MAG: methyltransferase domain-containing protein [Candidatus Omnitrophota bacterium]|nr:MAG: methyltransferase domain-containing protein [Candidatus Omnitrophota bacterium]